jgi:hypothetical protein
VCQWHNPICCITRLRLDAALYEPAPPRTPRQTGRPRLQGKRLPTLAHVLANAATGSHHDGAQLVCSDGAERRARLRHRGMVSRRNAPLSMRWMLVRDPYGEFEPQALLCTDLTVDAIQILEWCVRR